MFLVDNLEKVFFLPEPNRYIAEDLSLLPKKDDNPKYPQKVISNSLGTLYYKQDDKFEQPRALAGKTSHRIPHLL